MLSAWDVYWVMQLDNIGAFFTLVTIVPVVGAFVGLVVMPLTLDYVDDDHWPLIRKVLTRLLLFVWLPAGLVSVFIPSSKTAAAMLVLPALTSDAAVETIAPEAREIYNLAKQALRNVAEPPTKVEETK